MFSLLRTDFEEFRFSERSNPKMPSLSAHWKNFLSSARLTTTSIFFMINHSPPPNFRAGSMPAEKANQQFMFLVTSSGMISLCTALDFILKRCSKNRQLAALVSVLAEELPQ